MIVLSIPILMLRIIVNLGSHRLSYGPVLKVLATKNTQKQLSKQKTHSFLNTIIYSNNFKWIWIIFLKWNNSEKIAKKKKKAR